MESDDKRIIVCMTKKSLEIPQCIFSSEGVGLQGYQFEPTIAIPLDNSSSGVLQVTNLNGLPHSLLSYGHLIPGECACTGRTCLIKKFFQGPSKGWYIPWAVPEDRGCWLNGVLRGWSANG